MIVAVILGLLESEPSEVLEVLKTQFQQEVVIQATLHNLSDIRQCLRKCKPTAYLQVEAR